VDDHRDTRPAPAAPADTLAGSVVLEPSGEVHPAGTGPADTRPADALAGAGGDAGVTSEAAGRYRLGAEQGRGGQARVLLAVDAHVGREIAWKELLGEGEGGASQASSAARFLREARITG